METGMAQAASLSGVCLEQPWLGKVKGQADELLVLKLLPEPPGVGCWPGGQGDELHLSPRHGEFHQWYDWSHVFVVLRLKITQVLPPMLYVTK